MAYVVLIGPHFTVNILSLLRRFIKIYHDTSTSRSALIRSKRRSSPCIFQVVVSLSIRAFVHISPRIFSCFQLISVKSIRFSTRNSYFRNTFFIFCNNCRACVQPTLTCERARSGNEIGMKNLADTT